MTTRLPARKQRGKRGEGDFESEEDLVAWLTQRAPAVGDDAALLGPLGDHAITVDSQREGVHFTTGTPADIIATRLVAVNLSDLASVGATPHQVLCTLAAPAEFDRRSFFEALLAACAAYRIELVGGDLSTSTSVECTLTAIGKKLPRGQFLRRSAAKPGHGIWLAGSLGESAVGLRLLQAGASLKRNQKESPLKTGLEFRIPGRIPKELHSYATHCLRSHMAPRPQLTIALFLAKRKSAIAAIDISDGLCKDIGRLAIASSCSIVLGIKGLRSSCCFDELSALCEALDLKPHELLLSGGEDYALAFSLPNSLARPLSQFSARNHVPVRRIGEVIESRSAQHGPVALELEAGEIVPVENYLAQIGSTSGWDHLAPTRT